MYQLPFFEEAVHTFPLDDICSGKSLQHYSRPEAIPLIHKALVTGIRDYFSKSGLKMRINRTFRRN